MPFCLAADPAPPHVTCWFYAGEMRRVFEQLREQVGEACYLAELELAGVQNPSQFQSAHKALECYWRLARLAAQPEVA